MTFPSEVKNDVGEAIVLLTKTLIPAIFPFLVLSGVIMYSGSAALLGRLFRKPVSLLYSLSESSAGVILLGMISGYPAGARCAVQLYENGEIDKDECERLLTVCSFGSPAFIIAGIGMSMFNERKIGLILYFSQLLATLICGLFFRKNIKSPRSVQQTNERRAVFSFSVSSAASAMISVCANVIVFSVISGFLQRFLPEYPSTALGGFFEITNGAKCASLLPFPASFILASLICGWNGMSVHMQIASFCNPAKISMKKYFISKSASTLLCPVIACVLYRFLP